MNLVKSWHSTIVGRVHGELEQIAEKLKSELRRT